jgi:CRISPR system Cascade subunit CasC
MFKPKPGFRIELHYVVSHSASRLNRDGADRPKTLEFGGTRRLRQSSQNKKFTLRYSDDIRQFLDESNKTYGTTEAVQTRQAATMIKKHIHKKIEKLGFKPEAYNERIKKGISSLPTIFVSDKKTSASNEIKMPLVSFSKSEIEHIAEIMVSIDSENRIEIRDCASTLKELNKERNSAGGLSPEIQLFGRFTTACVYLKNIDCPLQVSHGFTVHKTKIEHDYWTAVDDLVKENGQRESGHINLRAFGAGAFYHYHCLDVPLLSRNISNAHPVLERTERITLTQDLIAAFLYAALTRNSTSGQSGHANHSLPSFSYITYGSAFPYDASSAFERPVQPDINGGYLVNAKKRFQDWMKERKKRYGIFCGYENGMGLDGLDNDLLSMIEDTVLQATPAINKNIGNA